MKFTVALLVLALSFSALAATPPEAVNGIDADREGDLSVTVVDYFKKNLAIACDSEQVVKIDVLKLTSSSNNEEKKPGTPYEYQAQYLVVQKCLYGSTFVGAYSDTMKSVILKGSFNAHYKKEGSFKRGATTDLKVEQVKEITDTNLSSI